MPTRLFQKGNKFAKGGARPGAGPKKDEFKAWLKKTIHSPRGRKRFEKIIGDEQDAETLVTSEGVEVPVRAKADTYLRALELGLSYERGKPVAIGALEDQDGNIVPVVVCLAAQVKGKAGEIQ